jgi:hypothetical protein
MSQQGGMPLAPVPQRRRRERFVAVVNLGTVVSALFVVALALLSLAASAGAVSATPTPPPGADGLQDLLNWTLYGGAICCAATSMYGFAKMGISHTQQSYQGANHGKSVAILGLVGALGLGLTPTIVNGLTAIH